MDPMGYPSSTHVQSLRFMMFVLNTETCALPSMVVFICSRVSRLHPHAYVNLCWLCWDTHCKQNTRAFEVWEPTMISSQTRKDATTENPLILPVLTWTLLAGLTPFYEINYNFVELGSPSPKTGWFSTQWPLCCRPIGTPLFDTPLKTWPWGTFLI